MIRRVELHREFGGSGQSGIAPSASTDNVLIFSDPASGDVHGYPDHEWPVELAEQIAERVEQRRLEDESRRARLKRDSEASLAAVGPARVSLAQRSDGAPPGETRPSSYARATACRRLCTASFVRVRWRWLDTVFGLITSRSEISRGV